MTFSKGKLLFGDMILNLPPGAYAAVTGQLPMWCRIWFATWLGAWFMSSVIAWARES